jgi:tetratricopeptide (TPR) repeat protein
MDTRTLRFLFLAIGVAAAALGPPPVPVHAAAGASPDDALATIDPLLSSSEVQFDSTATTEELLESAREMFLDDNYVLAEMLYKSVLIREPNHLFAMQELAIVYEAMGKLQYARGLLTRAAILKPYDQEIINKNNQVAAKLARTLSAEVDSLVASGAYALALPKLSVLLTTQPENAELHFKKATCHFELDDFQNALVAVEKAIELQNDPRFYELRSQAHTLQLNTKIGSLAREVRRRMNTGREDDRESALALVSQILELDPGNEWGQRYFLALTTGEDVIARPQAPDGPVLRFSGRVERATHGVMGVVMGAVTAVFGTLNRHLNILFYVLIALIIFGSPLTFMIIRGFSPRQSLSGRLNQFNIHEILTMIQTQNRTGILKISSSTTTGRIFFNSGEVYHCTSGSLEGRKALQHLIDKSADGYFVFTNSRRTFRATIDVPLSLILMDLPARSETNVSKGLPKSEEAAPVKKPSRMKELLDSKR